MATLIQDLRCGLRMLAKNPGFTGVAVLTLALGIGANTAIFSLVDAVMLRSMPVRDASQLVLFRWNAYHAPRMNEYSSFGDCPGGGLVNTSGCSFPIPVFEAMRSQIPEFSGVTAFAGPAQLDLAGNGPPTMASGELVSGDYFRLLGVSAAAGRTIAPEDDSPAAPPVLVLDYSYWQRAFGGERSAIGRTVVLNNVPFTVVGVAEPSFTSLSPGKAQDFWLPMAMLPRMGIDWGRNTKDLSNWWLVILARLRPGASLERAQAAASVLFRDEMLHGAKPLSKPQDNPAITLVRAQAGLAGRRGAFSTSLYVLMSAVGFILLIACANVAGLLVARATTRTKEMAVRLAMGAARGRILRQLLTESVMLSVAGGALGVIFAYWGVDVITRLISGGEADRFFFAVTPDWRVLVFTISISFLTGILFGLAPALRSARVDLGPALKESAPTSAIRSPRRFHLGNALVVAQVGLSLMLLVGAALLVRTLAKLADTNPGFETRNLLLFGVDPTLSGYRDSQIQDLYRRMQARLAALPGIISVSYSSDALLTGSLWTSTVRVDTKQGRKEVDVDTLAGGPGLFHTLRIPLVEGRTFSAADFEQASAGGEAPTVAAQAGGASAPRGAKPSPVEAAPIPALVNRAFVHSYLANENPLGRRLDKGDNDQSSGDGAVGKPKSRSFEIVGVVGDTKYSTLRRDVHPTIYMPLTGGGAHFELRTAGAPAAFIPSVRRAANEVDSHIPLYDVHTQTQKIEQLLVQERLVARLGGFFGVLAVLLACVGLYGLLSYEVTRRTREVGIRMALGAERQDILRLVVAHGFRLTLVGIAIGIPGALALTRFLSSLLYGVKPTDPLTFISVAVVLGGVALLASYIPARRATKVDPMVALRCE